MIDTEKLRQAVLEFQSHAAPSSSSKSDPATVGDIKKLIEKTATVLNQFIEELENND